MTRFLLVLSALLGWQATFAQSYYALLNPTYTWDEYHYVNSNFCPTSKIFRYQIQGDTLLAGKRYAKIVGYPFLFDVSAPPMCKIDGVDTTANVIPAQFMREDTLAGKVWLYQSDTLGEALLYDYSLIAGDTLHSPLNVNGTVLIVNNIDRISIEGRTHRVWVLNNGQSYIEGLGAAHGLFQPYGIPLGFTTAIECIKANGQPIYGTQCDNFFVSRDQGDLPSLDLYPNPSTGVITLAGFEGIIDLKVYTPQGQRVFHRDKLPPSAIDLSHLPSGTYFLVGVVQSTGQQVYRHLMLTR